MSKKISELDELAAADVDAADVIAIVDDSAGETKRISLIGVVQGAVIIESDSNANGSFVKYSGGTMICWGERLDTIATNEETAGNLSRSDRISTTFPAEFSDLPFVQLTTKRRSGTHEMYFVAIGDGPTETEFSYTYVSGQTTSLDRGLQFVAIGRWK